MYYDYGFPGIRHIISPQESLSELHGNVFEEKCEKCETRYERPMYTCDDISGQYFEDLEDYGRSDVKLPKYAKR